MVEKESVTIATGEVSRERWYLLTSLSSQQWGQRNCCKCSATTGALRTACIT